MHFRGTECDKVWEIIKGSTRGERGILGLVWGRVTDCHGCGGGKLEAERWQQREEVMEWRGTSWEVWHRLSAYEAAIRKLVTLRTAQTVKYNSIGRNHKTINPWPITILHKLEWNVIYFIFSFLNWKLIIFLTNYCHNDPPYLPTYKYLKHALLSEKKQTGT